MKLCVTSFSQRTQFQAETGMGTKGGHAKAPGTSHTRGCSYNWVSSILTGFWKSHKEEFELSFLKMKLKTILLLWFSQKDVDNVSGQVINEGGKYFIDSSYGQVLKVEEGYTKIWLMTDKSLWLKLNKFSDKRRPEFKER